MFIILAVFFSKEKKLINHLLFVLCSVIHNLIPFQFRELSNFRKDRLELSLHSIFFNQKKKELGNATKWYQHNNLFFYYSLNCTYRSLVLLFSRVPNKRLSTFFIWNSNLNNFSKLIIMCKFVTWFFLGNIQRCHSLFQ